MVFVTLYITIVHTLSGQRMHCSEPGLTPLGLCLRVLTCAAMCVSCAESHTTSYCRRVRMHAPQVALSTALSKLSILYVKLIFMQCDVQESNVTRVHKGTNGSDLA